MLGKALGAGLPPIVVLNKIDRKDARVGEVLNEIYDLFIELDATDEQLEFPVLYCNALAGVCDTQPEVAEDGSLEPLFEQILQSVPAPPCDLEGALQLQITTLDRDAYLGRLAIGRIHRGKASKSRPIVRCYGDGLIEPARIAILQGYQGLTRVEIEEAVAGEIVAVAGLEEIDIGDTLADPENPEPLPPLRVEQPTMAVHFKVNNSPFAGRSGKKLTSRQLRERLTREAHINVSIRFEETDSADNFKISGRGELQLAILIETMRREGYEMGVGKPEILTRTIDGKLHEPIELLIVDCPEEHVGKVTRMVGRRKGRMIKVTPLGSGRTRVEFHVPSRGLIGFRTRFLTETRGTGIMNHMFDRWDEWQGDIAQRDSGVLIADRSGKVTAYAVESLQPRGVFFVGPGTEVYAGMVVGEHNRASDLGINIVRERKLTNMRSATSEELTHLTPPRIFSLEQSLEFLHEDELLEVTPEAFRIRKKGQWTARG